jgi:hypothetical protein
VSTWKTRSDVSASRFPNPLQMYVSSSHLTPNLTLLWWVTSILNIHFFIFFFKNVWLSCSYCFRSRWESKCSCSRALWLSCMSSRRRVGMPYFCVHPSCIKHIYIKVSVLFQTDTAGLLDERAAASVQYQCLDCCNTVTSHILWVRIALYTSTHSVLLYLRFWNPRHNLM